MVEKLKKEKKLLQDNLNKCYEDIQIIESKNTHLLKEKSSSLSLIYRSSQRVPSLFRPLFWGVNVNRFLPFFLFCDCMCIASMWYFFWGDKWKIVDFFLMTNFFESIFYLLKMASKWILILDLLMPFFNKNQDSNQNLLMPLSSTQSSE